MTTRSPPPIINPQLSKEPKEDKNLNSNEIDNNGPNTNKAGINQSPVGGSNIKTTTDENRQANKGYRQAIPCENYGALFDIEYLYIPPKRKQDIKKEKPSDVVNNKRDSLTALERGVKESSDRAEAVDKRLESVGPGAESDMAYEGNRMNELEQRNRQHSVKIHELERELRNVQLENRRIKGQLIGPDTHNGFNERGADLDRIPERYEANDYSDPRYPEMSRNRPEADLPHAYGRRQYENEQHRVAHRQGGPDEKPYWGYNKLYDPQFITAYRRGQVAYYTKLEEREKQTQYADDYNYLHEIQRRQEEEWRRKRQKEEELLMKVKDKPKTYEYTVPYKSAELPLDINKYFHDSKYLESKPEPKPDEYYFKEEAHYPLSQRTGVSTYERAFISPRYRGMAQVQPGGIYLIRFQDYGYDEVRLAFREQQTLIKSYEGRVLGIARKNNMYAIEGDADWHYSRNQQHRRQVRMNYKNVEDAIAVLWFPSKTKAVEFSENRFRNKFRDVNFPTPQSYEAHYIAMLAKPFLRDLDSYLIIEVLSAKSYSPEQIQKFDTETREAILQFNPNSIPFIASTVEGHETLRPGPTSLFRDKNSKIFVSLFSSVSEISDLWEKGIVQYKLAEWNITGAVNVWAFSLKDWQD